MVVAMAMNVSITTVATVGVTIIVRRVISMITMVTAIIIEMMRGVLEVM